MTTRTCIMQDRDCNFHPVHAKLVTNHEGRPFTSMTKGKVQQEYPDMRWIGWTYDLANSEHREALKMYFLSPNVEAIWVWIDNGKSYVETRLTRGDI